MLARQPQGLVLDEPLAMLDPTAAQDFIQLLGDQVRAGKTLVVCEHRHEYLTDLPGLRTLHLVHDRPIQALPEVRLPQPGPDAGFELCVQDLHVERGGQTI